MSERPIERPIERAISAAGGINALSRQIGVAHPTIIGWRRRDQIPAERVRAVSAATGIPPHQLRPDLFDAPATATKVA
jgi:DNA-binding transcriptional regulator YdaS (Cro superfamily)